MVALFNILKKPKGSPLKATTSGVSFFMRKIADKQQRDFKGIWIPAEIWLNTDLSFLEVILLAEIDSLVKDEGCYASNAYFAEFLGVSETYVSKAISSLTKKGLVYQAAFNGRNRVLKTNLHNSKADLNKSARQTTTKVQPYNKEDNKEDNIEKKENYIKERKEGGATAPCRSPNGSLIDNDNGNTDAPKNDSFALVSDFDPKDEQSIPPGNKKPSKGKIPTKQQILAIYDAYPRKTAKQIGLLAIEKAIKKGYSPEMLLEKTNLYAQKMAWQEKRYIPFLSTWFNQERFLDDPSAWEAPTFNNNGRYSSQRRLSPDQIKPRTKREILMTEPWRANELKDIDDDDTPF